MKKKATVRFGRRVCTTLLAFMLVFATALGTVGASFAEEATASADDTIVIPAADQQSTAPQSTEEPEPTEVTPLESVNPLATTYGYGNLIYVVNDDNTTVSITYYNGDSKDVVVPAKIDGKDVTNIILRNLGSRSLTSLDVTDCIALTTLFCDSNQLTALDVSKNTALTTLHCYGNQLTALDVSKNTALTSLHCYENQLTSLNVNGATALTSLHCSSNQLTTLDVSNNPALTSLYCGANQLTTLDVSNNPALTSLYCSGNQLTALDVSITLKDLDCMMNQLTSLNLNGATALTQLSCAHNKLITLDVSNNPALKILYCYGNQLTALDLSKNTMLTYLACGSNYLPESELQTIENLGYAWVQRDLRPQNVPAPPVNPPAAPDPDPAPEPTPEQSAAISAFVERLYTEVLGRPSDPEKASHVNALAAHAIDGAQAAEGFFFSEEMNNRGLSDEQWIDICYRTFLDREADADGRQNWLNALDSGASRYFVFSGFVGSNEFSGICASYGIDRGFYASPESRDQSPAVRGFVYRLYTECLGRTPEPDGLNNWCAALLSGQLSGTEAARGFFYSEEFETKYTTNEEIVTAAYKALLGRDPDPAGLADWVSRLDGGASKEVIFHGFGMSPEFQSICASYGINQGTIANPGAN